MGEADRVKRAGAARENARQLKNFHKKRANDAEAEVARLQGELQAAQEELAESHGYSAMLDTTFRLLVDRYGTGQVWWTSAKEALDNPPAAVKEIQERLRASDEISRLQGELQAYATALVRHINRNDRTCPDCRSRGLTHKQGCPLAALIANPPAAVAEIVANLKRGERLRAWIREFWVVMGWLRDNGTESLYCHKVGKTAGESCKRYWFGIAATNPDDCSCGGLEALLKGEEGSTQ